MRENFNQKNWNLEGNKILKDNNDYKQSIKELELSMNNLNSDEYLSNPSLSRQISQMVETVRDYLNNTKPDTESKISQITDRVKSLYLILDDDQRRLIDDSTQEIENNEKRMEEIKEVQQKIKGMKYMAEKKAQEYNLDIEDVKYNVQEKKENVENDKGENIENDKGENVENNKEENSENGNNSTGNKKKLIFTFIIGFILGVIIGILLGMLF